MPAGAVTRRLALAFFVGPDPFGFLTPVSGLGSVGRPVKGRRACAGNCRNGGISNIFCSGISFWNIGTLGGGGGGVLFGSKRSVSGSESLRGDGEGERALKGGAGGGRRDLERPNGGILGMLYLEKDGCSRGFSRRRILLSTEKRTSVTKNCSRSGK